MSFMSFHIDGTERTGRTKILTCPAADTTLHIDYRNLWRICFFRIGSYHLYGTCRTMAGTVPAFHLVCDADAILLNPYGMTDLDGRFLGEARQMDGIGRSHLRTLGAFGAAVTAFVGHFRLHQFCQVRRRTEHLVGTYRYAELAGCAVLCKVAGAQ